jgi:hypothetical protein
MTPCQRKRILHLNIFQSTIKLTFYTNCLKSELFALFLAKTFSHKPCYLAVIPMIYCAFNSGHAALK